jgi:hypothetical protein
VSCDPGATDILEAVREVNWAGYAMPPSRQWYRPDSVIAAFELLLAASSQADGREAYNSMLSAIGNNHAGCLYPAAVPAAPLLVRVVRERQNWQRWAALEILIEYLAFDVDREQFVDPTGSVVRTKDAIVAVVRNARDEVDHIARTQGAVSIAAACQLLEHLDEFSETG